MRAQQVAIWISIDRPGWPAGGHTAEMMRLVAHLDWTRYSRRRWIISSGDALSEAKALALEKQIGSGQVCLRRRPPATLRRLNLPSHLAVSAAQDSARSPRPPVLPDSTLHDAVFARVLSLAHHPRPAAAPDQLGKQQAPSLCRPRPAKRARQLRPHHRRRLPSPSEQLRRSIPS